MNPSEPEPSASPIRERPQNASGALRPTEERASDQLERWFHEQGPRTLGSLIDLFGEKSFAVVFIMLMAVPALPLPTGGVTHVFEVITMLLALELIAGRRTIWLPERWKKRSWAARREGGGS